VKISLVVYAGIKQGAVTFVVPGTSAVNMDGREEFEFFDSHGKRLGTGTVIAVWSGAISLIPASMLERHHDFSARCYSGLVHNMRIQHGELIKNEESVVSAFSVQISSGEVLIPSKN
jgi:hypothetical protein